MPIRVALGDDNLLVREGLRQLLDSDPDIEVVATVGDLASLEQVCDRERPDVVVTDIRMPPTQTDEGIRLAADCASRHPGIGVVVLSQFSEPDYALALLERGSDRRAYLLKDRLHDRADLTAAVFAVAGGGSLVDPKVVEALVPARTPADRSPPGPAHAREREMLGEMAQGQEQQAIAEALFLERARRREAHQRDLHEARPVRCRRTSADPSSATLMLLAEPGGAVAPAPPNDFGEPTCVPSRPL